MLGLGGMRLLLVGSIPRAAVPVGLGDGSAALRQRTDMEAVPNIEGREALFRTHWTDKRHYIENRSRAALSLIGSYEWIEESLCLILRIGRSQNRKA